MAENGENFVIARVATVGVDRKAVKQRFGKKFGSRLVRVTGGGICKTHEYNRGVSCSTTGCGFAGEARAKSLDVDNGSRWPAMKFSTRTRPSSGYGRQVEKQGFAQTRSEPLISVPRLARVQNRAGRSAARWRVSGI
jgi:hypothetical protein